MRCCCNVKGFITSIDIKTGKVQVKAEDGKTYSGVQLISPLGTNTVPQITINAEILLQKSLGSDDSVFGIPFNRIQQFITLPLESQGDYAVGSTVGKNNIAFKASGETVENAKSKELIVNAYNVNAGDLSIRSTNYSVNANLITNESSLGGQVNIDTLIEIKNQASNLKDIINQILVASQGITVTNPETGTGIPINNAPAFASIIPLLNSLLK